MHVYKYTCIWHKKYTIFINIDIKIYITYSILTKKTFEIFAVKNFFFLENTYNNFFCNLLCELWP